MDFNALQGRADVECQTRAGALALGAVDTSLVRGLASVAVHLACGARITAVDLNAASGTSHGRLAWGRSLLGAADARQDRHGTRLGRDVVLGCSDPEAVSARQPSGNVGATGASK